MPTYQNISNKIQISHNINFKPLETKDVIFYIYDEINFKKISDNPIFSPIVYSQKLTAGQTLKVKDHLVDINNANQIRLVSKTYSLVSFNGDTNKMLVTEHPEYIKPIHIIDSIKCEEGEVSVEFWRPANWRN